MTQCLSRKSNDLVNITKSQHDGELTCIDEVDVISSKKSPMQCSSLSEQFTLKDLSECDFNL